MPYDWTRTKSLIHGDPRGGDAAFHRKAKIEESLGRFCDSRIVDNALQNAARIAREIVSFRHPRISAIELAVADPNADLLRGDVTADEMREEGSLPPPVEHQGLVEGGRARPRSR